MNRRPTLAADSGAKNSHEESVGNKREYGYEGEFADAETYDDEEEEEEREEDQKEEEDDHDDGEEEGEGGGGGGGEEEEEIIGGTPTIISPLASTLVKFKSSISNHEYEGENADEEEGTPTPLSKQSSMSKSSSLKNNRVQAESFFGQNKSSWRTESSQSLNRYQANPKIPADTNKRDALDALAVKDEVDGRSFENDKSDSDSESFKSVYEYEQSNFDQQTRGSKNKISRSSLSGVSSKRVHFESKTLNEDFSNLTDGVGKVKRGYENGNTFEKHNTAEIASNALHEPISTPVLISRSTSSQTFSLKKLSTKDGFSQISGKTVSETTVPPLISKTTSVQVESSPFPYLRDIITAIKSPELTEYIQQLIHLYSPKTTTKDNTFDYSLAVNKLSERNPVQYSTFENDNIPYNKEASDQYFIEEEEGEKEDEEEEEEQNVGVQNPITSRQMNDSTISRRVSDAMTAPIQSPTISRRVSDAMTSPNHLPRQGSNGASFRSFGQVNTKHHYGDGQISDVMGSENETSRKPSSTESPPQPSPSKSTPAPPGIPQGGPVATPHERFSDAFAQNVAHHVESYLDSLRTLNHEAVQTPEQHGKEFSHLHISHYEGDVIYPQQTSSQIPDDDVVLNLKSSGFEDSPLSLPHSQSHSVSQLKDPSRRPSYDVSPPKYVLSQTSNYIPMPVTSKNSDSAYQSYSIIASRDELDGWAASVYEAASEATANSRLEPSSTSKAMSGSKKPSSKSKATAGSNKPSSRLQPTKEPQEASEHNTVSGFKASKSSKFKASSKLKPSSKMKAISEKTKEGSGPNGYNDFSDNIDAIDDNIISLKNPKTPCIPYDTAYSSKAVQDSLISELTTCDRLAVVNSQIKQPVSLAENFQSSNCKICYFIVASFLCALVCILYIV